MIQILFLYPIYTDHDLNQNLASLNVEIFYFFIGTMFADVFLKVERRKIPWYQNASRMAGILVCSPDLGIEDFLQTDAWFFWVDVAGIRVYGCYFSPNDPFEIFET